MAEWKIKNPERYRAHQAAWRERSRTVLAAARSRPEYKERKRIARRRRVTEAPWINILSQARVRSKRKGLDYGLSSSWAKARWTGRCEITGAEFRISRGAPNPYSPSIDRIDSSKGYTPENCRFILWAINQFKGAHSDAAMLEIARLLVSGQ
jgi:hypothetical protein